MTRYVYYAMRVCVIAVVAAIVGALSIMVVGSIASAIGGAVADAYVPDDVDALPTVDAAIVLGTAPYGDAGQRFRTLSRRLQAAYDLWSHGKARYLIVSGNRIDDGYDEPSRMRDGLAALGVPTAFVYLDPLGTRTWESMVRAREIYGLRQTIVVSERDHLARALLIARDIGIDAWGYAAEDTIDGGVRGLVVRQLAILLAYFDLVFDRRGREGPAVSIGVDPP